jgi:hypothetical protein
VKYFPVRDRHGCRILYVHGGSECESSKLMNQQKTSLMTNSKKSTNHPIKIPSISHQFRTLEAIKDAPHRSIPCDSTEFAGWHARANVTGESLDFTRTHVICSDECEKYANSLDNCGLNARVKSHTMSRVAVRVFCFVFRCACVDVAMKHSCFALFLSADQRREVMTMRKSPSRLLMGNFVCISA